ncbi:MAG TPA: hypothetical protein VFY98_07315 [Intrasporangium sp.]|nr:hypothetical protein [Intrasporangium sp.]
MSDQLDALERELIGLGHDLVPDPPPAGLAAAVLDRIADDAPVVAVAERRRPERRRSEHGRPTRRLAWAVAAMVVAVVALVPPVRAAVMELLHIGGVVVREEPGPPPLPSTPGSMPGSGASPTLGQGATTVTLDEARRVLGFDFGVPTVLGPPETVTVSHEGRVAELSWGEGTAMTRLDVFAGSPDWGYLKRVWTAVTPTVVKGREAVWLEATHEVEWVDRRGVTQTAAPRLAGPTLIWVAPTPDGRELTYRLEGRSTMAAALDIATTIP